MAFRSIAMIAAAFAAALASAPAAAAPPPSTVKIVPDSAESLQWSAAVVRVDPLRRQGPLTVKLFGTAGGDPAMNGLYTYLAFFDSPAEGWRVFRIGDVLTYRLLAETPGRVTLEVRDNVMNPATGAIGTRLRRLTLSWRPGASLPDSVNVTATP